jgi:hypothetical protein
VENACLAFALSQGQHVSYWREQSLEVDAVLDGSWGEWAVEVCTGRFASSDLRGLAEFTRREPRFAPLVLTSPGEEEAATRFGVQARSWPEFLLSGPPR